MVVMVESVERGCDDIEQDSSSKMMSMMSYLYMYIITHLSTSVNLLTSAECPSELSVKGEKH